MITFSVYIVIFIISFLILLISLVQIWGIIKNNQNGQIEKNAEPPLVFLSVIILISLVVCFGMIVQILEITKELDKLPLK